MSSRGSRGQGYEEREEEGEVGEAHSNPSPRGRLAGESGVDIAAR